MNSKASQVPNRITLVLRSKQYETLCYEMYWKFRQVAPVQQFAVLSHFVTVISRPIVRGHRCNHRDASFCLSVRETVEIREKKNEKRNVEEDEERTWHEQSLFQVVHVHLCSSGPRTCLHVTSSHEDERRGRAVRVRGGCRRGQSRSNHRDARLTDNFAKSLVRRGEEPSHIGADHEVMEFQRTFGSTFPSTFTDGSTGKARQRMNWIRIVGRRRKSRDSNESNGDGRRVESRVGKKRSTQGDKKRKRSRGIGTKVASSITSTDKRPS